MRKEKDIGMNGNVKSAILYTSLNGAKMNETDMIDFATLWNKKLPTKAEVTPCQ